MTQTTFRSNGKLMISGEYLVLAGATALALPVRYGQSLAVSSPNEYVSAPEGKLSDSNACFDPILPKENWHVPSINWCSLENGREWFSAIFKGNTLDVTETSDIVIAEILQKILLEAKSMNPAFLSESAGWNVVAEADFDRHWGLGSSSTLISNIAWWADINPYQLLFRTMEGSGYDIACARNNHPILYKYRGKEDNMLNCPQVEKVAFAPPFAEKLMFVYTGRKQSSSKSLKVFNPDLVSLEDVNKITELSYEIIKSQNIYQFMELIEVHERITGGVIGKMPVKEMHYDDFRGAVKSLGAWGGDFLLAASATGQAYIDAYFRKKGHDVILSYEDMLIKPSQK